MPVSLPVFRCATVTAPWWGAGCQKKGLSLRRDLLPRADGSRTVLWEACAVGLFFAVFLQHVKELGVNCQLSIDRFPTPFRAKRNKKSCITS